MIAIPDPTTVTITTSVWYDVGSKHDPEGRSGFAHLFEHILSRKTENMPYNMINRLTEDVGGQRNASTGGDRTNYYEIVPAQYLETMLWTHAERMARPVVDDEVFERERSIVKEELRQRVLAPPYGRLQRFVLAENAYDHAAGPPPRHRLHRAAQFRHARRRARVPPGLLRARHRYPDRRRQLRPGRLRALVDQYFAAIPRARRPVIDRNRRARDAPHHARAPSPGPGPTCRCPRSARSTSCRNRSSRHGRR